MLTLEKFYFGFDAAAAGHISLGANGNDYHVEFIASEEDPITISVTVRGEEDFRRFLEHLTSLGAMLLECSASATARNAVDHVDGLGTERPRATNDSSTASLSASAQGDANSSKSKS